MSHRIAKIFNPISIAVVGASADPKKLGTVLLSNLIAGKFPGQIYPINPKSDRICNLPAYKNVSAVPDQVDQVAILIPAAGVLDVVKDCVKAHVSSIIIISAGFGELNEAGKQLETTIAKLCQDNHISLVGPNIIGVINPYQQLNNSWMQIMPAQGDIAFVSQSGALCCSALDVAQDLQLGFFNFCSVGNKADVNELDLFKYWNEQSTVKVMAAYLEEIRYGEDFIRFIEHEVKKPVIIFKSGKTNQAKAAIASHTGSMAGSVETIRTAFDKAGIIEAHSTNDFFNAMQAFSFTDTMPTGSNVCVITNAGGAGIIATDEIIQQGLKLAKLSDKTIAKLQATLPPAASSSNPTDILGEAPASRYQQAADIIGQDPGVDMVLFVLTPQYVTQVKETAQVIIDFARQHPTKTVAAAFIGETTIKPGIDLMIKHHLLAYNDVASAVRVLSQLATYGSYRRQQKLRNVEIKYAQLAHFGQGKHHQAVAAATTSEPHVLSETLVNQLIKEVELDVPKQTLVSSYQQAERFCANIYPVVIKAPNAAIAHKTDFQAVFVNIGNKTELKKYYLQLEQTIKQHGTPAYKKQPQILIQEMIDKQLEFLIGANRDGSSDVYADNNSGFGHLLVFGQGGIYTEVFKDLAYSLVPASRSELKAALQRTHVAKIIAGTRGQPPLAADKILDAIERIQDLLIKYPEIVSLDLNPLLVTTKRAVAVDVKIFVAK